MIIKTTSGQLFRVRETGDEDLAHVWFGIEVRQQPSKSSVFPEPLFYAKTSRETLVRKAGCKIIAQQG